jgi:hypothetical protein
VNGDLMKKKSAQYIDLLKMVPVVQGKKPNRIYKPFKMVHVVQGK